MQWNHQAFGIPISGEDTEQRAEVRALEHESQPTLPQFSLGNGAIPAEGLTQGYRGQPCYQKVLWRKALNAKQIKVHSDQISVYMLEPG